MKHGYVVTKDQNLNWNYTTVIVTNDSGFNENEAKPSSCAKIHLKGQQGGFLAIANWIHS